MVTRIIIVRHGNTFSKGQVPTRVGGGTDLPLVEEERGTFIGKYLKDKNLIPDVVFSSPLKRTMQTAALAIKELGITVQIITDESFREIDYGPDENHTETEVMLRLGKLYLEKEGEEFFNFSDEDIIARGEEVIDDWNREAIVPDGWEVSPEEMIKNWKNWGRKAEKEFQGKNILIVSSNGIMRFAPYLTGDFRTFTENYDLKVGTGNICIFEKQESEDSWKCVEWNFNPRK